MNNHLRALIVLLRVGAVVVMVILGSLLWRLMAALPWHVDCVIAAVAALAFSYRFERATDNDG